MDKLIIGQIVKCIGLKGMLKVVPITKDIKRFKQLKEVYLEGIENPFKVEFANPAGLFVNLKLEGYSTIESVEAYKNKYLLVDRRNAIELEEGEYFIQDLIGCKVFYYDGKLIGEISAVDNFGANDILYIKSAKDEVAVAFLDGIFETVDIKNKTIKASKKFDEVYLECE